MVVDIDWCKYSMSQAEIPVVDFSSVFSCADLASCPQTAQIHTAFTTVGFVFIKNHGIQRKLVRFGI